MISPFNGYNIQMEGAVSFRVRLILVNKNLCTVH
jgi:hypothetical protein